MTVCFAEGCQVEDPQGYDNAFCQDCTERLYAQVPDRAKRPAGPDGGEI